MYVKFNDLSRIHKPLIKDSLKEFSKAVENSQFVLNQDVQDFECQYAEFTGQKYALGCANGTDALEIILRGLEIGNGDEVIIPVNTFIATALAVSRTGATPIFVDNDEYYLIDTEKIEKKINKKTKAIIAVHLYGQMADMSKIKAIAKKYKLKLLEDAAQAHGSYFLNTKVGDGSIAAAYSFYPGKNLGAWGDGGAVTTNSKTFYKKIKLIRDFGSKSKYEHEVLGFNSRLQPIQGIVLSKKLVDLKEWNEERNEIAKIYNDKLSDLDEVILPKTVPGNYHVWHLYVLRVKKRNNLIDFGKKNGVEFGIHYPKPVNKQNAYKSHRQFKSKFVRSDKYSGSLISLPIFPKMKLSEVNYVISVIKKFYSK